MADSANQIQPSKDETGVYYVNGQTWKVGSRYTLVRVLGLGSFSCVCLAVDNTTQEKVALKRIPDVLSNAENTKRVLREVCILRRLEHPNIIQLKDVFLKPSATGRYVYRGGALVPTSLDLYLSTEYCDQGDLFHMKGQLGEAEVCGIMWQLLAAVQYLHDNGVWHRDIKTANIYSSYAADGARQVKLGDLGSARSVIYEGRGSYHTGASGNPSRRGSAAGAAAAAAALPRPPSVDGGGVPTVTRHSIDRQSGELPLGAQRQLPGMPHSGSFLVPEANRSPSEITCRMGSGGGLKSPLTRLVCTPCYRAPEVIMSRGGYTSDMDMWSVGCVFGELLQRVAYIGKATTPHLQVAPVFAVHGAPQTPGPGEVYAGGPGSLVTRRELHALFEVIGTPSWRCIAAVPSPAWRAYLKNIPGKAPTLFRRFGAAGEVAVDLLARLLTFDPARRCGCEEALAHEYFEELRDTLAGEGGGDPVAAVAAVAGRQGASTARVDLDMEDAQQTPQGLPPLLQQQQQQQQQQAAAGGRPPLAPARSNSGEVAAEVAAASVRAVTLNGQKRTRSSSGGGSVEGERRFAKAVSFDLTPDEAAGGLTPDAAAAVAAAAAAAGRGEEGSGEDMELDHHGSPGPQDMSLHHTYHEQQAGAHQAVVHHSPTRFRPPAAAPAGAGMPAPACKALQRSSSHPELFSTPSGNHYYDIDDPAAALAALEAEMAALISAGEDAAAGGAEEPANGPGSEGLRRLLEKEVQEHSEALHRKQKLPAVEAASPGSPRAAKALTSSGLARRWEHLKPDPGHVTDPSRIGFERLPFHADAEQAKLEPELHLRAGRHGEWAPEPLKVNKAPGPSWGVTAVPPGMSEEEHPLMVEIMRSQNKR